MRERLFAAIWVEHRNISSPYEVRRIVTELMYPPVPLARHRATEIARRCAATPTRRVTRRLGGTVTPDGGPLTTAAWLRIRDWRQEGRSFGNKT